MEIAEAAQATVVTPTGISKLAVKSLLALAIILKTHLRMELVVEAMATSVLVVALATAARPPVTVEHHLHTATVDTRHHSARAVAQIQRSALMALVVDPKATIARVAALAIAAVV
jgi:hypothetical protein